MAIKKVFVDSENTIIAVHDEAQDIGDHAYDAHGVGETRVIYLPDEDIPPQQVADGLSLPWKMSSGWWDTMNDAVPDRISGTQGKLTLLAKGKYEAALAVINALSGAEKLAAQIKWEAANWYRADPLFNSLGAGIGMSPTDIDDAFREGRDAS